jgi:hypothetical protein
MTFDQIAQSLLRLQERLLLPLRLAFWTSGTAEVGQEMVVVADQIVTQEVAAETLEDQIVAVQEMVQDQVDAQRVSLLESQLELNSKYQKVDRLIFSGGLLI